MTAEEHSPKNKKRDPREVQRNRYRPVRVKLLFIGEAPPASGRFFYHKDSGLYCAFRTSFIKAFPVLENKDFLKKFQALGCYLIDLCPKPVDRLDRRKRIRVCKQSEFRLVQAIRRLRPEIIVSVVRSISSNVGRAQKRAKWTGKYLSLPYPGRWRRHQVKFDEALVHLLRSELDSVETDPKSPSERTKDMVRKNHFAIC